MLLIAHRGLMDGPDKTLENSPEQIRLALAEGFDAEIDLWNIENEFFLGHDEPIHKIQWNFLDNKHLWVHCKNLDALYVVRKQFSQCHYFWHQSDDYTLTSNGYIWTYPGYDLTKDSICVLPEWEMGDLSDYVYPDCYGICSDYVKLLKSNEDKYGAIAGDCKP
jgi:hypothetical protein